MSWKDSVPKSRTNWRNPEGLNPFIKIVFICFAVPPPAAGSLYVGLLHRIFKKIEHKVELFEYQLALKVPYILPVI